MHIRHTRPTQFPTHLEGAGRRHWLARSLGVAIAIAASSALANAQQDRVAQTTPLTFERARVIARERGPLASVAGAQRLIAEGRARADGALPNPSLEWRKENLGNVMPPDIFVTMQLPVDVTGRRLALRNAFSAGAARGRSDSIATLRRLDLEVARAFWRASLADTLLAIANDELGNRLRLAAFDSSRVREGAIAEVVWMRTRLDADRARMLRTQARMEDERARAELARMLGTVADSIGAIAPIPVLTTSDLAPALDATSAQTFALANRPDLQSMRAAADEAGLRATAERRGMIADLQLVSGYKKTSGVNTGVLGVTVPLPVLNRNDGARMRARGEQLMASAELRDAELRVRGEVSSAIRAYEALRTAWVDGASSTDARAAEVASISEAAYREGASSVLEVIEAARVRAEMRASVLRWTVDILLAKLELDHAMAAPLMELR